MNNQTIITMLTAFFIMYKSVEWLDFSMLLAGVVLMLGGMFVN